MTNTIKTRIIAIVSIACILTTITLIYFLTRQVAPTQAIPPKSAEDGVTAANHGDYEKAVKIWYSLAKQGDGPSKKNLHNLLVDAARETNYANYKQASEMLRPLVARKYPAPANLDGTLAVGDTFNLREQSYVYALEYVCALDLEATGVVQTEHRTERQRRLDEALAGFMGKRFWKRLDATSLLELTEFFIEQDRLIYSDPGYSGTQIRELMTEWILNNLRDKSAEYREQVAKHAKIRKALEKATDENGAPLSGEQVRAIIRGN